LIKAHSLETNNLKLADNLEKKMTEEKTDLLMNDEEERRNER
jgi:hypothetical protein